MTWDEAQTKADELDNWPENITEHDRTMYRNLWGEIYFHESNGVNSHIVEANKDAAHRIIRQYVEGMK